MNTIGTGSIARLVALSLLFSLARPCAAHTAWQPSPGYTQVPVWSLTALQDAQRGSDWCASMLRTGTSIRTGSACPDFAVALYPGHLAVPEKNFALNPDLHLSRQTSPTFLLHAEDDPTDPVENSLVYYAALKKAGVPAEMHVHVKGGHAFGLRRTESPITGWPQLVETWLVTIGMISK